MKISYGNSRMDKKWKNSEISWDDFCKRVSSTIRTTETIEEYIEYYNKDRIKEKLGYLSPIEYREKNAA